MIRNAIWLLVAFAGAVVLALFFQGNHGNVTLTWPPYQIELSSNMLLVLLIIGFLILHLALLLVLRTLGLPQRIRRKREQRRLQRNNRSLQEAVLAHFEGRFERAERLSAAVLAHTPEGNRKDQGAAAALLAALSAHRLGNYARRDDWTRQAVRRGGKTAALMALAGYGQAGRWDQVLETVRQLTRRGKLAANEADNLRLSAYRQLLARRAGDAEALNALWKSLSADERKKGMLAAPTMTALAEANATGDARRIGIGLLDDSYDEGVLEAYASLEALPARQRLEQLERWRLRHGEKPRLLEMLGRICASERLWGKAEGYLVDSLLAGDSVSARVALAQLYESVGRPQEAALQFQYAARLSLGERPPLPEPIGAASLPGAAGAGAGARSGSSPLPPDIPAPRLQGQSAPHTAPLGQGGAPLQASAQEVEAARGTLTQATTPASMSPASGAAPTSAQTSAGSTAQPAPASKAQPAAARLTGITVVSARAADSRTAVVTLQARSHPPFLPWGIIPAEGFTITATGSARMTTTQ